ncbi:MULTISPECIES: helix-turn-helix domain-containing protein, partial [Enorma]
MYDGETVRRALAEGMTQSEAAALCGVTRQTVRNWAAGR